MDTAKMNELLEYKDKIKASQAKRASFSAEWLSYVTENGFDEKAEQYLFTGFEYRKMHPFVDYLKTVENKRENVLKFLNGKQFSKNKPKSFKMALNLLVILFGELPEEQTLMVYVIRRLPSVSVGKDKKRMPETGKAFEKFFFPEFTESLILPDLQTMGELKPVSVSEFRALVSDALDMIADNGEIDKKIKEAFAKTSTWIKGSPVAEASVQESIGGESKNVTQSEEGSNNESAPAEKQEKPKDDSPVLSWRSSLKFISSTIERYELQGRLLQEQLLRKDREIVELGDKLSRNESALSKALEDGKTLRAKEIQLSRDIDNLKSTIADLNKTVMEKEKEIADRSKLADMLSRDTSKQSDAVLKRLSSELASYYEDFVAAKDEPVTEEIGDILKDQLSEIFAILKKNGIGLQ